MSQFDFRDSDEEDDRPSRRRRNRVRHGPPKSGGSAAVLELVFGLFLQTFGVGHMYAGNVGLGLLLMFGYWFVLFANVLLCFLGIGFVTGPACWLLALVVSPLLAAQSCSER